MLLIYNSGLLTWAFKKGIPLIYISTHNIKWISRDLYYHHSKHIFPHFTYTHQHT